MKCLAKGSFLQDSEHFFLTCWKTCPSKLAFPMTISRNGSFHLIKAVRASGHSVSARASPTMASKTIGATLWGALTASVWFTSWKQVLKCIYLDSHHLSLLSATRHALQVLTLLETSWVLANTDRNGNGGCRPEQARFVLWLFKLKSCSHIVGKQILLFLKGHCNSRFNFLAQFY